MITADRWKEYQVIDTSDGEKLELWNGYRLLRPDPQVIWHTEGFDAKCRSINAHYHRSSKGGGEWEFFDLPKQWQIHYELPEAAVRFGTEGTLIGRTGLVFNLKPFSFKHTGLFPEQAANWDWFSGLIADRISKDPSRIVRVLNLFAYTGGATLASAASGASVTHVDASKGMVSWARENAASSGLSEAPVRWLVDDCVKFVERELRRGSRYDAVIMDPPSYGRGPKGEIWKIEDHIFNLVTLCTGLLSDDPLFFLINSYTTGLQAGVLSYMLSDLVVKKHGGFVSSDEIGLPVRDSGLILPCGAAGRWQK